MSSKAPPPPRKRGAKAAPAQAETAPLPPEHMHHPRIVGPNPGASITPRLFYDHLAMASHVATIVQVWSIVENELALLVMTMKGNDNDDGATLAIYGELISVETKLMAVRAVAKIRLPKEKYGEFFPSLYKEIKACANLRNQIAHARWGTNDDYPSALILVPAVGRSWHQGQKYLAFSEMDFVAIIRRIAALSARLRNFSISVRGP